MLATISTTAAAVSSMGAVVSARSLGPTDEPDLDAKPDLGYGCHTLDG